jgi:AcrR family transcriptional regulator
MKNQKDDRRSTRTRNLLDQAFYELMQKKRYDDITVQDILDQADVGRSTFYAHYQDKEDLLMHSLEDVMDLFVQHVEGEEGRQPSILTEDFFQHIQENRQLYQAIAWGRGMELLFDKGQTQVSRNIAAHLASQVKAGEEPAIPVEVTATYLSGAFLVLIKWWVENKFPYSPRQMSEMFQSLAMFGTIQAMQTGGK